MASADRQRLVFNALGGVARAVPLTDAQPGHLNGRLSLFDLRVRP